MPPPPSLQSARETATQAASAAVQHLRAHVEASRAWYAQLPLWKKCLVTAAAVAAAAVLLTVLVMHKQYMALLVRGADRFARLPYSHVLLFALVVAVAVPPLIGYTALGLLSGLAYGFPHGWPVLALGTVVGSSLSYLVCSRFFYERARQLALRSERFARLVAVLREDSFFLLFLFRLCPLPYSLSNAALSAIPSVSFTHFAGATALSTPKLFIPVFVGSRLALAERTGVGRANFASALLASVASAVISYLVYARMAAIAPPEDAGESADEFEVVE